MADRKRLTLVALTLAALSLAGCSTPTPDPLTSPSSTPSATQVDAYQSDILLANNELEEEFLEIALASCELTKTKSLSLYDLQGNTSTTTYFRPSDNLLDPENQLSENALGDFIPGIYTENLPALFYPCLLEAQAASAADLNAELFEHTVEKIGPFNYVWSQHQGGANLETLYFDVMDGLISQYSKEQGSAIKTEVAYTDFSGDVADFFVGTYGY